MSFLIKSPNAALASINALLLGASCFVLGPALASNREEQGQSRGLVNKRVVPVGPSDSRGLNPGDTLPESEATDVPVDTLLRIGFDNAPVLRGNGTIKNRRASDQAVVDTIDLRDP